MAGPVLLVIAVACLSPSPAVARSLLQTVGVKNVTVPDPLSSLCAVVAGQTTTECRPGCQVCQAVFDPNNDRNWVPPKKRACVCCAPGRMPHEKVPAACRLVSGQA